MWTFIAHIALRKTSSALVGLSVFGATQMTQCKRRNGENNRTLSLTLSLTPSLTLILTLTLTLTLFLTLNLTLNDYFPLRRLRCAICVAPNTDSPLVAKLLQG